jgi:hypothetical protein
MRDPAEGEELPPRGTRFGNWSGVRLVWWSGWSGARYERNFGEPGFVVSAIWIEESDTDAAAHQCRSSYVSTGCSVLVFAEWILFGLVLDTPLFILCFSSVAPFVLAIAVSCRLSV